MENCRGMILTKVGMLWCTGLKLLSEGGQGGRGTNLIRKSIPYSGSIKSKTITKLFDRFMNRRAKLWNDKEITTILTAPGTVRTAVGRKICSKIPGKTRQSNSKMATLISKLKLMKL